jgi:uncharacterized OB-fold protein
VTSIPVAEGLFTWPSEEPRLIGSRCLACGTTTFPQQPSCPKCAGSATEERLLSRTGSLWSFTVQGFRPKSPYNGPDEFEPYGVGYVELPGEVMVEARLTESDPAALAIGAVMELDVVPFRRDEDGNDIVTFAFRPVAVARVKDPDRCERPSASEGAANNGLRGRGTQ